MKKPRARTEPPAQLEHPALAEVLSLTQETTRDWSRNRTEREQPTKPETDPSTTAQKPTP